TVSFNGTPATAPLTFTSNIAPSAATLLANLSTIPDLAGNISVTGAAGGPFTITFQNPALNGTLAGTNVTPLTATTTGGTTATITTRIDGGTAFPGLGGAGAFGTPTGPKVTVFGNKGGPFEIVFDSDKLPLAGNGLGQVA